MGRLVVFCLALALPLLSAPPASAFCRLTTDTPTGSSVCVTTGFPLEWQRQCISYSLTDTIAPGGPPLDDARDVADLSFDAWLEVECDSGPVPLLVRQTENLGECLEPEYNPKGRDPKRNANTVIFISDWSAQDLDPRALGLTELWHDPNSGRIYDADMRINQSRGVPTRCAASGCPPGAIDLQNVLTHEAGHFFGLAHSSVSGATMASSAVDGETSKRSLEQDDRDGICSIYGELEPPACRASDFQPDNGFAAGCKVPAPGGSSTCAAASAASPESAAPAAAAMLALLALWGRRRRAGATER